MLLPIESLEQLAKTSVALWSIDAELIELFSQSENTVFKIKDRAGKHYALRVHRPGYHTRAELESEQQWTEFLSKSGIAVPTAVKSKDGRYFEEVSVAGTEETRQIGVVDWVAGVPLSEILQDDPSQTRIRSTFRTLGGLMANFHLASKSWKPSPVFVRHSWDTEGFVGEKPFWGKFWELGASDEETRQRLVSIKNQIQDLLSHLPQDKNCFGMIHADMHLDNVLKDGERLNVIDFDDAGYGWHAFDLAVGIYHLLLSPTLRTHFELVRSSVAEGYLEIRPESEYIVAMVPLFLLIRSLVTLKWIEDRPEVGHGDMIPKLIELAFEQARGLSLEF